MEVGSEGADDGGVEEDGDGKAEAELFHSKVAHEGEDEGDSDHDGGCIRDDGGGALHAGGDRLIGAQALLLELLDPAHYEHLVVDGEAEEEGEEEQA